MKSNILSVILILMSTLIACHLDNETISEIDELIEPHIVLSENFVAKWEASSLQGIKKQELEWKSQNLKSDTSKFMEDIRGRSQMIEFISSSSGYRTSFIEYLILNQEKLQTIRGDIYIIETFDMPNMCDGYNNEVYLFSLDDSICNVQRFSLADDKWIHVFEAGCTDVDIPDYFSQLGFVADDNIRWADPIIYSHISKKEEITSKVLYDYDETLKQEIQKLWRVKP